MKSKRFIITLFSLSFVIVMTLAFIGLYSFDGMIGEREIIKATIISLGIYFIVIITNYKDIKKYINKNR